MNNAKMWLVVNPTVGIPLFLGAVAVGSFAVHVAVLSNTTWVSDFLSGQPLGTGTAAVEQPAADTDLANTVVVDPSAFRASAQGNKALLIMPDGSTAEVIVRQPEQSAAAATPISHTLPLLE